MTNGYFCDQPVESRNARLLTLFFNSCVDNDMTVSSRNRAFWPTVLVGISAIAVVEAGLGEDVNRSSGGTSPIESESRESKESRLRESTMRSTESTYSLLFDHLELGVQERSELLSLLVEDRIAGTWTGYKKGIEIDRDEQSKRIAAIIGDAKLRQFRRLEENLGSYWELSEIVFMFGETDNPLSKTQQDELLAVLIETRIQHEHDSPPDSKTHCVEYVEYRLLQLDERQRHVLELAPSVLSSQQVIHLHKLYEHQSYNRAKALELQKWREVHDPAADTSCWYPRWSSPRRRN